MTRSEIIRRLVVLRADVDRELGRLLADLERERGKHAERPDVDLDGCDVCGACHWVNCSCNPNAEEHVRHVQRLLRSGADVGDTGEAEQALAAED